MENTFREDIRHSMRCLAEWEQTPLEPSAAYEDMNMRELKLLLTYQAKMLEANDRLLAEKDKEQARMTDILEETRRANEQLRDDSAQLNQRISQLSQRIEELLKERSADREEISLLRKSLTDALNNIANLTATRFAPKSQKGSGRKDRKRMDNEDKANAVPGDRTLPEAGTCREAEKEGFSDRGSVQILPGTDFTDEAGNPEEPKPREARPYRKGKIHSKPHADQKVHKYSDRNLLPEGFVFKGYGEKSVFKKVTHILEEVFHTVIAEDADGNRYEFYLPAEEGKEKSIECFPGTMASPEMMSECVIDHYVLNIPYYREWKWLKDCGLHIVRQTYINWMYTGYLKLRNLIPHLLDTAVQKDSIINCDETWCKVKIKGKYRKRYTWCLVNKALGIVIYFYKNGARSREAFKEILDGRLPMAVQTDGYNVYMYIENELEDVTHLCCMAHARAKFKITWDITKEPDAKFFLDNIGFLYGREHHYKTMGYGPGEIKKERNSARSLAALGDMRTRLTELIKEGHPPRSELLDKALRYMDSFWPQLVEYLKDGRFDIDNSEAEQAIRPLANERKNSLFYGSHKMAAASAVYHSLIATCRKVGISVKQYFEKLFKEIIQGNQDWANLLPMTIGIPVKKL